MRSPAITMTVIALLAGCAQSDTDEAVKVMSQRGNTVVIRGLVDAKRDTPPERFDNVARDVCAGKGKTSQFVSMKQVATFAFDVTYSCV